MRRCSEAVVKDVSFTYALHRDPITIPAVVLKFLVICVLFKLDNPRKCRAAFENEWIPDAVLEWLGLARLEDLSSKARMGWVPPKLLLDVLGQHAGRLLIELAQPQPAVIIRQVIRNLFLRKARLCDGGVVFHETYWKWFLKQAHKPMPQTVFEEVGERIQWELGQLDLAQVTPKQWHAVPQLSEGDRRILQAAVVDIAPERLEAINAALAAGLFDFIPDLFATSYSAHGRRAYHPMLLWKMLLAMVATGLMEPGAFLTRVNDSVQLRLFLGVMRASQLPSARRVKGFLTERLAPAIEYVVLWLNLNLVERGGIEVPNEFGTDGMEMASQARCKSDATAAHLAPVLSWMLSEIRRFLEAHGRTDLTDHEREMFIASLRDLQWKQMGNIGKSRHAILSAVRAALEGQVVTPRIGRVQFEIHARDGPIPDEFGAFMTQLVQGFEGHLNVFGPSFDGATLYDPEGSARTKRGKTVHGFGLQFLNDLTYGFVWAFAVFPAGQAFKPFISEFVVDFQKTFTLGPMNLTSDREFTIAQAIHQWHAQQIDHYGPRADVDVKKTGVFTQKDFEVHETYAVCPNGKKLHRKPHVFVRGSNVQWRYQALGSDCKDCPLRPQCTKGRRAKMLCINVYRDDLEQHAERMKQDPARTSDLLGRHRALAEGTVNNLKTHLQARDAQWKGLAMARLQLGLAIVMINTLKWRKVRTCQLQPMQLKAAG